MSELSKSTWIIRSLVISVYFCLPYFTLLSSMLFSQYKVTKDFSKILIYEVFPLVR